MGSSDLFPLEYPWLSFQAMTSAGRNGQDALKSSEKSPSLRTCLLLLAHCLLCAHYTQVCAASRMLVWSLWVGDGDQHLLCSRAGFAFSPWNPVFGLHLLGIKLALESCRSGTHVGLAHDEARGVQSGCPSFSSPQTGFGYSVRVWLQLQPWECG